MVARQKVGLQEKKNHRRHHRQAAQAAHQGVVAWDHHDRHSQLEDQQVEISQEKINMKQADAERRRSAVGCILHRTTLFFKQTYKYNKPST